MSEGEGMGEQKLGRARSVSQYVREWVGCSFGTLSRQMRIRLNSDTYLASYTSYVRQQLNDWQQPCLIKIECISSNSTTDLFLSLDRFLNC